MHKVFKVIAGRAVSIGQQRKRRDARHQARMVRLKPTTLDCITLESMRRTIRLNARYTDDARSSLDVFI